MTDHEKLKPMVKLTVADLLEDREDGFTSSTMFHGRMIAFDAGHGKTIFDTRRHKKEYISRFYDRTVCAMWVEMRETWKPAGYRASYEAVLCCYLHHIEKDKEGDHA